MTKKLFLPLFIVLALLGMRAEAANYPPPPPECISGMPMSCRAACLGADTVEEFDDKCPFRCSNPGCREWVEGYENFMAEAAKNKAACLAARKHPEPGKVLVHRSDGACSWASPQH
ncbi:MAG TPA: hypothetical protein VHB73_05365 [Alphaproteobacteria bacterium]|nr:hypothetical protein [Alphaproteobacteria bacterium]